LAKNLVFYFEKNSYFIISLCLTPDDFTHEGTRGILTQDLFTRGAVKKGKEGQCAPSVAAPFIALEF
jgi:hypothetical protein